MLAALAQMRMPPRGHAPSEHDWRRELVAGARYAFGFFPARCALLLLAAVSITVGSYVALMPWFAREAFHGDSGTLGILIRSEERRVGKGCRSWWEQGRCIKKEMQ